MLTGELSEAEQLVWAAYPRGAWADVAGVTDPTVRAEVLEALLLGAAEREPGAAPAVRVRDARVTGRLDLMGATVDCPLIFLRCDFDEEPRFVEAATKALRFVDSRMPSFDGARVRVEGPLNFSGTTVAGRLRLDRARVANEVSMLGTHLGNDPAGVALAAEGISVDGLLELRAGFTATGELSFHGARIGGSVDLSDASLSCPGAYALRIGTSTIGGRFGAERLTAEGCVWLSNMRLAGSISLGGARLVNPGGLAFGATGLEAGGGFWGRDGFTAEGEVRLRGTKLRYVDLTGARISNPGGIALTFDQAVLGDFDGADLVVDGGETRFVNAQVTSRLRLAGARLEVGVGATALAIDSATVGGALDLTRLTSLGEVSVRTSQVGRQLLIMDAVLDNGTDKALRLSRSEIAADMFCYGMRATGEVKLTGARIGAMLGLDGVRIANPGNVAVDAVTVQAGGFSLRAVAVEGLVTLRHAKVDRLRDDPATWPAALNLDGLTYTTLEPRLPARERLRWLERDPEGYQPRPYEHLAAWYTATGQPDQARRVLHAKERRRRTIMTRPGRAWSLLQDVTVAYGYQPWRALLWLILLLTAGSAVYGITPPPPLQAGAAPHFNAVIYTLDLLLPIVDLGQKHAFDPGGAEQWLSYALIAAGWLLATTIATGVARVINRG